MARMIAERYEIAGPGRPDQPGADQIRTEVARVIASPSFNASKRSQQFLQYVCDKALSGEEGALKERMIAVDVFGRKLHADLGEDTIVRVGAREVRKRLAQFYSTPEGAASLIRIGLPSGSYVPEFRFPEVARPAPFEAQPAIVSAPRTEARPVARIRPLVLAGSVAGALLAAALVVSAIRPAPAGENHPAFEKFWEPVFSSADPLLLVVGNPLVYHPSARAIRLSEGRLPPLTLPAQRPIEGKPEEFTGADMVPVLNQYVGFGDMVVATEVASMLGRRSRTTRVRLASSVPFADLRQNRSVLIGAITNRWTMELGRDWRYRFVRTPEWTFAIEDTQQTPAKAYRIAFADDGSVSEDYLLLSRVLRSSAGGMQIVAAGIKQFGTEAAGRVLTDPAHLNSLLRKLPAGWESKNLQLLLHVKVIGNTPDQPELVAAHVW